MTKTDLNLPPSVIVAASAFGRELPTIEETSFEAQLWMAGDLRIAQKRATSPRMPWQEIALRLASRLPQDVVKAIVIDTIERREKGLNTVPDDEKPRAVEVETYAPEMLKALTTPKSSGSKVVVDNLQVSLLGGS